MPKNNGAPQNSTDYVPYSSDFFKTSTTTTTTTTPNNNNTTELPSRGKEHHKITHLRDLLSSYLNPRKEQDSTELKLKIEEFAAGALKEQFFFATFFTDSAGLPNIDSGMSEESQKETDKAKEAFDIALALLNLIYDANQKLLSNQKLQPNLDMDGATVIYPDDTEFDPKFDYWSISNVVFDINLQEASWEETTLKNITFDSNSIYRIKELGKANIDDIESIKLDGMDEDEEDEVGLDATTQRLALKYAIEKRQDQKKFNELEKEHDKLLMEHESLKKAHNELQKTHEALEIDYKSLKSTQGITDDQRKQRQKRAKIDTPENTPSKFDFSA